jgi:hypothetical protein
LSLGSITWKSRFMPMRLVSNKRSFRTECEEPSSSASRRKERERSPWVTAWPMSMRLVRFRTRIFMRLEVIPGWSGPVTVTRMHWLMWDPLRA